jgi:hypothetical protein
MRFFDQIESGYSGRRRLQISASVPSTMLVGIKELRRAQRVATLRMLVLTAVAVWLLCPTTCGAQSPQRASASLVINAYVLPIVNVSTIESKILASTRAGKAQLIIQLPSSGTAPIESLAPLDQSPWGATARLTPPGLPSRGLMEKIASGLKSIQSLPRMAPEPLPEKGTMLQTHTYVAP